MTTPEHADLTAECAREPIRIPGSVQDHGVLIALRYSDLTILQISENATTLLGFEPDELLHQPLSKLMPIEHVESAKSRMQERQPRILNPLPIRIRTGESTLEFDGILHRSGRLLILELERHVRARDEAGVGGVNAVVRGVTSKIIDAPNLEESLRVTCDDLRRITGYSRVLIYRFDEGWDGQVIAESLGPDGESLMSHRFPASDIPAQARELYAVNWVRIIPDCNFRPARLVPEINPITDEPTDLSNSVLRSVSPVHVEYMRNMGYDASLSVSLLKSGKLWGLISCHNRTPKFLPYETRIAAESIGQILSLRIALAHDAAAEDTQRALNKFLEGLLRSTEVGNRVLPPLRRQPELVLAIVNAQGLVVCDGEAFESFGNVPSEVTIRALRDRLDEQGDGFFVTRSIKTDLGIENPVPHVAGILSMTLGGDQRRRWIFTRPERVDSALWSGNPHEAKYRDEDGRIRPRKSFATWTETIRHTSDAWRPAEIAAAHELRRILETFDLGSPQPGQRPVPVADHPAPADPVGGLNAFPDLAAFVIDARGSILHWSLGAEHLLKYAGAHAGTLNVDSLFSPEDRIRGLRDTLLAEAGRVRVLHHEGWLYRADHTVFYAKLRIARTATAGANTYSVLIEDISREKFAQEDLKATKVAAEAANVAKTAFLANISHEIRTPLGAVMGFAELLAKGEASSAERRRLFDRIQSNGNQLLALINDLLDMTKVETNKLQIEHIRFDLSAFLLDLRDTFRLKASERGVTFDISLSGALPRHVTSDPTRLRQVLVNLLSNAIKFTESGGRVTLYAFADETRRLEFRVEDTGRGMSEREMSQLFQPFAQADVSTTRKYGGTGLGLFISQRIARLLKGDLSIEASTVGRGSTFLAWIEPEAVDADQFTRLIEGAAGGKLSGGGRRKVLSDRRILVTDDSEDNRELIGVFLERAGARITFANDGREALDACAKSEFDVVLMDIQMPIMDGPTALRELTARGLKTPVVALTAHAMSEERQKILNMGFANYLTKPINWPELIKVIGQLCAREL